MSSDDIPGPEFVLAAEGGERSVCWSKENSPKSFWGKRVKKEFAVCGSSFPQHHNQAIDRQTDVRSSRADKLPQQQLRRGHHQTLITLGDHCWYTFIRDGHQVVHDTMHECRCILFCDSVNIVILQELLYDIKNFGPILGYQRRGFGWTPSVVAVVCYMKVAEESRT